MTDHITFPPQRKRFVQQQINETVEQELKGVTVRLATITCRCGWKRGITQMYKCLYCGEWLCELCAEKHFGKTREEYKQANAALAIGDE